MHATCRGFHFDSDAKQLCNTLPCVCPTSTCATRRQKLQQAHLSDTAREDFPMCHCFWVSTLQGQSSCPYWGHDLNTTVRAWPHSEGEISDGQISCLHHSRCVGFMGNVQRLTYCLHNTNSNQQQAFQVDFVWQTKSYEVLVLAMCGACSSMWLANYTHQHFIATATKAWSECRLWKANASLWLIATFVSVKAVVPLHPRLLACLAERAAL